MFRISFSSSSRLLGVPSEIQMRGPWAFKEDIGKEEDVQKRVFIQPRVCGPQEGKQGCLSRDCRIYGFSHSLTFLCLPVPQFPHLEEESLVFSAFAAW